MSQRTYNINKFAKNFNCHQLILAQGYAWIKQQVNKYLHKVHMFHYYLCHRVISLDRISFCLELQVSCISFRDNWRRFQQAKCPSCRPTNSIEALKK